MELKKIIMIAQTMNANDLVKTLAGLKQEQFSGNLLVKSTAREGILAQDWNFACFWGGFCTRLEAIIL